jgi:arginine decarboxylase
MKITVTWGIGAGHTKLSSFDKALWNAGIANCNIIPLSSIIPPAAKIEIQKTNIQNDPNNFGKRLYAVLSVNSTVRQGESAFAGLGFRLRLKNKGGLFVEHQGRSEEEVKNKIILSLADMVKYRRERYGKIQYKICGIECKNQPVTALVCAVYQIEPW